MYSQGRFYANVFSGYSCMQSKLTVEWGWTFGILKCHLQTIIGGALKARSVRNFAAQLNLTNNPARSSLVFYSSDLEHSATTTADVRCMPRLVMPATYYPLPIYVWATWQHFCCCIRPSQTRHPVAGSGSPVECARIQKRSPTRSGLTVGWLPVYLDIECYRRTAAVCAYSRDGIVWEVEWKNLFRTCTFSASRGWPFGRPAGGPLPLPLSSCLPERPSVLSEPWNSGGK